MAEPDQALLAKIAVGLALLTLLIFLPVVSMNWVNLDDDVFVTNNPLVAQLGEVVRLAPGELDARIDQATYLSVAGKEAEALASLEETVRIAPTNSLALSNLDGLLARNGRVQEAIGHYRAALNFTPHNPVRRAAGAPLAVGLRPLSAGHRSFGHR